MFDNIFPLKRNSEYDRTEEMHEEDDTSHVRTKAQWLCDQFIKEFLDQFADAENKDGSDAGFYITIREFDDWVQKIGEVEPDASKNDRTIVRNTVRKQMNDCASKGKHGLPAFSVDVAEYNRRYVVRLIPYRAEVLARELATSTTRYLKNRCKAWAGEVSFMTSEKVENKYPQAAAEFKQSDEIIKIQLRIAEEMFSTVSEHLLKLAETSQRVRKDMQRLR